MEIEKSVDYLGRDLTHLNFKLSPFYHFSKYFLIARMLMNRGAPVRLKVFKRDIFFNNINCLGIIEKGINEVDSTLIDIYKKMDCFVDVGAHIGIKTIVFHEINPEAECIMFEPITMTCNLLKKNTGHITNSRIFEVAISDSEKRAPIFFDEDHLDVSSLDEHHYFLKKNAKKSIKSQEVISRPLDSFFELIKDKRSVYLKIDVEAKEREVLKGAQNFLSKVSYLEIEIAQENGHPLSETLQLINRKFNIIRVDFFKGDGYLPKAVNLLLELC